MKKKLKNITEMARPKGKRYFTCSFALTQEQINFLQQKPNASEMIREIIDSLISMYSDMKPQFDVLQLKNQVEDLEKQYRRLYKERAFYESEHARDIYEEGYPTVKKLKSTSEAQYHLKILESYDTALEQIENKHEKLKEKIMETEFK